MDCSMPGLPVPHCLPEFVQVHIHWIRDVIQPSHPPLPSSPFVSVLSCFSCIRLFVILWTVAGQALLSVGFSRQEYWSGLPCSSPGDLPDQGSNLWRLHCRQILYRWATREAPLRCLQKSTSQEGKNVNLMNKLQSVWEMFSSIYQKRCHWSKSLGILMKQGHSGLGHTCSSLLACTGEAGWQRVGKEMSSCLDGPFCLWGWSLSWVRAMAAATSVPL